MNTSNVVQLKEQQNKAYAALIEQRRALIDTDPLSLFSTATLARAARGELDLNKLAAVELAQRGQDQNGNWVGFERAHQAALASLMGCRSAD